MTGKTEITLSMRSAAIFLCAIALLLTALSATTYLIEHVGIELPVTLHRLFDVNEESNVPEWYSSILLFGCALLLGLIAAIKGALEGRFFLHWCVLALLFAGLSLDEHATIHEIGNSLSTDSILFGSLHYGWVIFAAPAAALIGAAYLRFLKHLPREIRLMFVAAAGIYVGAALGMELSESILTVDRGENAFLTLASVHIEETLEMLGVVLFAYSLASYLHRHAFPGSIRLSRGTDDVFRLEIHGPQAAEDLPLNEVAFRRRFSQLQVLQPETAPEPKKISVR